MVSVEKIRQQLIDSQLMTAEDVDGQIERWREDTGTDGDAGDALVDWLEQQQLLTEFQAEAIRAGQTGPFMLGPYRVFERLAVGRLGSIYRAVHEELQQPVSLKVFPSSLNDDAEKVARMQREFRSTVELERRAD